MSLVKLKQINRLVEEKEFCFDWFKTDGTKKTYRAPTKGQALGAALSLGLTLDVDNIEVIEATQTAPKVETEVGIIDQMRTTDFYDLVKALDKATKILNKYSTGEIA